MNKNTRNRIEKGTARRRAWAENINNYKTQEVEEETSFVKKVRMTALAKWLKQDEVDINEIRFSYKLVKNGLFTRIFKSIINPFSKESNQYRLVPSKNETDSNNIEVTFTLSENDQWKSKTNLVNQSDNEIKF